VGETVTITMRVTNPNAKSLNAAQPAGPLTVNGSDRVQTDVGSDTGARRLARSRGHRQLHLAVPGDRRRRRQDFTQIRAYVDGRCVYQDAEKIDSDDECLDRATVSLEVGDASVQELGGPFLPAAKNAKALATSDARANASADVPLDFNTYNRGGGRAARHGRVAHSDQISPDNPRDSLTVQANRVATLLRLPTTDPAFDHFPRNTEMALTPTEQE
jgi:hypothetical protein